MKLVNLSTWLFAGLISLTLQSTAVATTVHFSTGSAQFSDVSHNPGIRYRTSSNDQAGKASLSWNGKHSGFSRIRFDGYDLPGQGNLHFSDIGSPFALGKLAFQNGGACGLPGINSADLTLAFLWGDAPAVQIDFSMDLTEKSLTGRHKRRGDVLSLTPSSNSFEINTGNGQYRLDLLGWSRDGGVTFIDSLFVADHSNKRMQLFASLQSVSSLPPPYPQAVVPVPAAAWLLGSGLLGLIGLARRR